MLWAAIVLIVLAIIVPAPLAPGIQDGVASTSETLAPWFFLWVQQLLALGDPFVFGVLIPLGALLLVAFVPYFKPQRISPADLGRWFPRGGGDKQILVSSLG